MASGWFCVLTDHTLGRLVNGQHRQDTERSAGMECRPLQSLAACTWHSAATGHSTISEQRKTTAEFTCKCCVHKLYISQYPECRLRTIKITLNYQRCVNTEWKICYLIKKMSMGMFLSTGNNLKRSQFNEVSHIRRQVWQEMFQQVCAQIMSDHNNEN